jgi:hypothetical protein
MHLRITLSVSVYSFIMVVGQAGFTSYSQRADIYIVRAKIQSSNRRQAVAFMKKKNTLDVRKIVIDDNFCQLVVLGLC